MKDQDSKGIFSSVAETLPKLQPLVGQIIEANNLKELGKAVFDVFKKDFDFTSTGFYFIHSDTKKLELILAEGLSEEDKLEAQASAMDRHPGWVIKNKKTYLSGNDPIDKVDFHKRLGLTSRLYSPIIYKGECVGTLGVASSVPNAFNENHVAFVEFICKITAVAYENIIHLQALTRSQERLDQAIQALNFGIWDWDIKHNHLIWDDYMYKLYDVDQSEFTGAYDAFEKTLHPDDALRVQEELQATFRHHKDFSSEFRVITKDGKVKRMAASGRCFYSESGEILRMVGANWDVTDQREQELHLLQISKLSSLGEMSAGIAHEINNPLAIILGKTQHLKLLLNQDPPPLAQIRKHADSIEQTTGRIGKIVKGLQAFSRDAGKEPFEKRSLKTIIEDTTSFCISRFRNHDVELQIQEISPQLTLECRSTQISQVLLNLLNNAFDAVSLLPEKWVKLSVIEESAWINIQVIDSGKGIPHEISNRILEPFFTTKDVGKGTGLGLSISHGIIKAHHGVLFIEKDHENTCFVVRLPKLQNKI